MGNKKNYILIIIFIIFTISACGKKDAASPAAEESFFFKVQFVLGDVKITGIAGDKGAIQGDQLKTGDVITTGEKAVADLIYSTSGVIRISENSRVTIKSIADKTGDDTVMDMDNGKVFLALSKLGNTGFKVKTPTAVASVRGTSFTVVTDKKGAKLSVLKGTVAVNPVKDGKTIEDKTVSVGTGNRTDYIDNKAVEKIITGEIEIPVMEMTPAEKIDIHAEVKDMKVEDIPELSLEFKEAMKEEIKDYSAVLPEKADKNEALKKASAEKAARAAAIKKLAIEKKQKEDEMKKIAEEEKLAQEKKQKEDEIEKQAEEMRKKEELRKQAEEKKIKEEKLKKDRASNIPTM